LHVGLEILIWLTEQKPCQAVNFSDVRRARGASAGGWGIGGGAYRGATGKVCLKLSKNSCKRKSARDGALFWTDRAVRCTGRSAYDTAA
jgi:hypothetical protein